MSNEQLVPYDENLVLEKSKEILRDKGELPLGCPKKRCLSVNTIILEEGSKITKIVLGANPPPPEKVPGMSRHQTNPICQLCGIDGNSNRVFVVRQNKSGTIVTAEAKYHNDLNPVSWL